MSRGDRWAAVALALALGGCMRIYPDPELPDIELEWPADFSCSEDDGERVMVSLSTIDPVAEIDTATVPCRDGSVRFEDVARVSYRLESRLEDTTGTVLGSYDEVVDLRDGLSERVFAFFGRMPDSNFRVAWTFDMGASCESLAVTSMQLLATEVGGGATFGFDAPCDAPAYRNSIQLDGTYTLTAYALAIDRAVAASPESAPFAVTRGVVADVGILTLSPCGAACPQLGPE